MKMNPPQRKRKGVSVAVVIMVVVARRKPPLPLKTLHRIAAAEALSRRSQETMLSGLAAHCTSPGWRAVQVVER